MLPYNNPDAVAVPDEFSSNGKDEYGQSMMKQIQLQETEDCGERGNISFYNTVHQVHEVQLFSGFENFDAFCSEVSSTFQLCVEQRKNIQSEIMGLVAVKDEKTSSAPFALVKNSGSKFGQCNGVSNVPKYEAECSRAGNQALSTTEIIRLAGQKLVQSSSPRINDVLELNHPFSISLSGVPDDKARDVEVLQHLLASAEKVGQEQFDSASKLLHLCDEYSCTEGNPVQRLVHYFSEALWGIIERKTGPTTRSSRDMKSVDIAEAMRCPSSAILASNKQVPFSQVARFSGMQAILDNITQAKKIHLVDLEIRFGAHSSIFMQALASRDECPVEHLKITAVGTKSKPNIEETGTLLKSFAKSINLSFSYNVVIVSDMLDLNESLFDLKSDEVVAVHSPYLLWTMLGRQDKLECLMTVMRSLNPRVMVVAEIESNLNSPVFVNRFVECLFYYGAYFDSLADCMSQDSANREIIESLYFAPAIKNVLMAEKEGRTIRHVKINIWRAFFAKFGMVQNELSMSCLYQAMLVANNFACENSCSLEMDGKSLLIGWKGTPVISLSSWKFI